MNRKTITKVALSTIAAVAFGCSTDAQRDVRANEQIAKGADEAKDRLVESEIEYDEEVREAADERVSEIMRADAELAEAVVDARKTAEPTDVRGMGTPLVGIGRDLTDTTPNTTATKDGVKDDTTPTTPGDTTPDTRKRDLEKLEYARFESVKDEGVATFRARAEAQLTVLASDYEMLNTEARKQTVPSKLTGDLEAAAEAIGEARKDLAEVRDATGSRLDDGRLGVGTAINKAQRNLTAANKALRDLRS